MRKYVISVCVLITILAMLITGCGAGSENSTSSGTKDSATRLAEIGFYETGEKIVEQKTTLSLFGLTWASLLGSKEDWEKNNFWRWREEATNVHYEFKQIVNGPKWKEQMNLAVAAGELPDVFYKSAFDKVTEVKYGSD